MLYGLANLTEEIIATAFAIWQKPVVITVADLALASRKEVSLKMARKALLVSTHEMGLRMNIRRQTYFKLEQSAERGSISVANLKRAADALDCECFVTIRPKKGRSFMRSVWMPLLEEAVKWHWLRRLKWKHNIFNALGTRLNETFNTPRFRRKQRWTRLRYTKMNSWGEKIPFPDK